MRMLYLRAPLSITIYFIPGINYESLVVEIAQQAIESKLLVDEDVDFLKNFLQLEVKAKKKGGLWLVPVVAMVPLALLTSSSSSSVSRLLGLTGFALGVGLGCLQMKQVFRHNRIVKSHCNLLESSTRLKSILDESVKLVKGLELVGKYYRLPVQDSSQMFSKLRQTVLQSTRAAIYKTRETTQQIVQSCPLSGEYDESDQYLANVELTKFSLEEDETGPVTVTRMRDSVNLLLLLQSELHRRFCLSFCSELRPEVTVVEMVWRLCQDLTLTMDTLSSHLRTVLRYHQSLGCLGVEETQSTPGKSEVSGSPLTFQLTRGSLHLQNCLLKLRQMTDVPDSDLLNTKASLVDIISELKTSQEILDDALETVEITINPRHIKQIQCNEIEEEKPAEDGRTIIILNENDEILHEDEVFEAFIKKEMCEAKEDEKVLEDRAVKKDQKQSRRVLSELKTVLVEKQKEWRVREGKAIARQRGVEYVEDNVDYSLCPSDLRTFRQAHLSDEEEEESSSVENIPAAVGHQLLSNNKLFRRPRRAAATKTKTRRLDSSERSENIIIDREGIARTLNIQPTGFDSQLATEAVSKLLSLKETRSFQESKEEEYFGDSDG